LIDCEKSGLSRFSSSVGVFDSSSPMSSERSSATALKRYRYDNSNRKRSDPVQGSIQTGPKDNGNTRLQKLQHDNSSAASDFKPEQGKQGGCMVETLEKPEVQLLKLAISQQYFALLADRLSKGLLAPFRCHRCGAPSLDPCGRDGKHQWLCADCSDPEGRSGWRI
jgi:hypothetical protein